MGNALFRLLSVGMSLFFFTACGNSGKDFISPVPGNFGLIEIRSIADTSLTLNWTTATDNKCTAEEIEYLAYYSTRPNISTVTDCETNGAAVGTFEPGITGKIISDLSAATIYYFNVIAMDKSGNKSAYSMAVIPEGTQAEPDTTAPSPGNSGSINTEDVTETGLTLNWAAGSDNISAREDLRYQVYYSSVDNISTADDCNANGTPVGPDETDSISKNITGLSPGTTYYFNLVIIDVSGNRAAYTTLNITTPAPGDTEAPAPGNSGRLSASDVAETSITLAWAAAIDNISDTSDLSYLVYYSESDTIGSLTECEANGIAVDSFTANITAKEITGLKSTTTYYFNVVVKDEAENKSIYTSFSQATLDVTDPVPGDTGALSASAVTGTTVTVEWTAASDNFSATSALRYLVYYSTSDNIDTVANCKSNGTAFEGHTAGITSKEVTGLSSATTYYFNVVVKDEAENEAAYVSFSDTTDDIVAPIPGNSGTLSASNVTSTSATVGWTEGTDNATAAASLTYLVYYSTSDTLTTVSEWETSGTAVDSYIANINSKEISPLDSSTVYYFNVIVKDEAGNKALYSTLRQATEDVTDPDPGNSGTLSASDISATSVTINWTAAEDDFSKPSTLTYLVYYSTSDNIDTLEACESNGTQVDTYTADITTMEVTGLSSSTTYYFNVVVRDEAGNRAVYSRVIQATSDVTSPIPGSSGGLSASAVSATSVSISWNAASDDFNKPSELQYLVYYSTSDTLSTISDWEASGTPVDLYAAGITSKEVSPLNSSTTYYFNVIVKDEAENKALYSTLTKATKDITAPAPGNPSTISTADVTHNSLTLSWKAGSDNLTLTADLRYLVYFSESDNLGSPDACENNGTSLGSYETGITSKSVAGLSPSTTYYFNVVVEDEAGNSAVYTTVSETTSEAVWEVFGFRTGLIARGLRIDSSGNIWVADTGNHRIVQIDSSGSVIAKYGVSDGLYSESGTGDGEFNSPNDIAFDSNGDIFIADSGNDRIQKFDSSMNFLGKWGTTGTGNTNLDNPTGIAIDTSDNIYIADFNNDRIQMFDSDMNYLATSTEAHTNNPVKLNIDSDGFLYAIDEKNWNRSHKLNPDMTLTSTPISYKHATDSSHVYGITPGTGSSPAVYIVGRDYNNVHQFSNDGTFLTTFGSATETYKPYAIISDTEGALYVTGGLSSHQGYVTKYNASHAFQWTYKAHEDGGFNTPSGIATDSSGNIYVTDEKLNLVKKFNSAGTFIGKYGANNGNGDSGTGNGEFNAPRGIAVDASGNIWVADSGNHRVQKFDSNMNFQGKWGAGSGDGSSGSGLGEFNDPTGIVFDSSGYIYVLDKRNDRIQKFNSAMTFQSWFGKDTTDAVAWHTSGSSNYGAEDGSFDYPYGIAIDASGDLYVTDNNNNRIQKISPASGFIGKWALSNPLGITIHSNGSIYVVEADQDKVIKFNSTMTQIDEFGGIEGSNVGEFYGVTGITVCPNGTVIVTESLNSRVQKIE